MVTIRIIDNPFKPAKARIEDIPYMRDKTLGEFLNDAGVDYKGKRIIVSGRRTDDLCSRLDNDDEIIVMPDIKAPVVAIGMAVVSAIVSFAPVLLAAASVLAVGYSIYQYMNRPRQPDFNLGASGGVGSLDEGSPTYGWDGVQTIQEVGVPVPICYGQHRVGGNIINQFLWDSGENQYLNALLGLCEGEIESVEDIEINSNPISNFSGVNVIRRFGTNDQPLISNFEDLHNLYPVNATLTQNNPYTYTTIDSDVEGFEIHLRLNNGLYQQAGGGALSSWSVVYRVEYKLHSDITYIDLGETTISERSRTTVRRVFRRVGLAPGRYDIRVTRTSEDSSLDPLKQGDLVWFQMDELKTDDLRYPNTALLGLELLATDQLSGSMPNVTAIVKGRKVSVPDIRNAGAAVGWDDYYWDGSDYRLFSDDTLLSWDGATYVDRYCANPVWCLRDLITNPRYGLGEFISGLNLDTAILLEMARYCEERVPDGEGSFEKRFRLDVVIDSNTKALDLLIQLCATFNAMPVYSAGGISFKIDKEDVPVQLFGMGNIVKDSFVQSWKTLKEIPNVIEVQFMDKDKNYQQETICCIDEESLGNGDPVRKSQIRLFATKTSYAIRAARYALKVARYINRTISFKAGIDAVCAQAGDLISVSHDVPQWGFSGRVKQGSTATLIKLDREMMIEDGKSYRIQIRFSDDSIEERLVASSAGPYPEIECEPFSQAPQDFDIYVTGEVSKVKKDFRVVSVHRDGKDEVGITALEYNDNVYDDSDIILPQNNYSALSGEIPLVENLRLTESLIRKTDGTIENAIDVWFDKPELIDYYARSYIKARIFISDNAGLSWRTAGDTTDTHFRITGDISDAALYRVKVVSVSDGDRQGSFEDAPFGDITIIGKSAPPSDVVSFLVNQARDMLYFGWSRIDDVDAWGYEIRRGSDWEGGEFVTFQQGISFLTRDIKIGAGMSYWIKAIDTSGNYSANAKEAVITITAVPFRNIVTGFEEHPDWAGIKANTEEAGGILSIADGYMEGTYTAPARDLGYVAAVHIGIDDVASMLTDRRFNSDGASRFNDSASFRFTGEEVFGGASFRIRISQDNIVWSEWTAYQLGDYYCRYFQIEMTLTRENLGDHIGCSRLSYFGDLPDIDERGSNEITDAAAGRQIFFGNTFHDEPNVHIEITGGGGIYSRFVSKSTTGFTVKLYNAQGAEQAGTFDWHAHGI